MSPAPERRRRPRDRSDRPEYTVYRTRPRVLSRRSSEAEGDGGRVPLRERLRSAEGPRRSPWRRILRWLAIAIAAWLALSLVLFLVSAQLEQGKVSDAANDALDTAGPMPFAGNTILVLGSDARPPGTKEPGANPSGPSRSDTIMLIHAGGGHSARLGIPRDTIVDIPGHGRDKINAAYAIGGPALAITTVKRFLGIEINHLVEVNFVNFPKFIDALGGVDYTGPCVFSEINGGRRNGGFTLRLRRGTHHIDGRQALALARTRKNDCNPREDDLDRARRQQKILSAIKSKLLSPSTFFRLPWVSWRAPQTIRSDMAGPSLLGLFTSMALTSSPRPRVLEESGFAPTPGGGSGIVVSDAERRAEVRRFLKH